MQRLAKSVQPLPHLCEVHDNFIRSVCYANAYMASVSVLKVCQVSMFVFVFAQAHVCVLACLHAHVRVVCLQAFTGVCKSVRVYNVRK